MTKFAVFASEQGERGKTKGKNNAKFMDCHEFARLRFANSRNDEFLSYLINFVILRR